LPTGATAAAGGTPPPTRPRKPGFPRGAPPGPDRNRCPRPGHWSPPGQGRNRFTPAQALEGLLDSGGPVTFFGHTHHQGGFSYQDSELEVLQLRPRAAERFAALRIEPSRRYLLNPGSIGQPRDGDPRAAFAVAELDHQIVEFWRVPYDISSVQARMRAAGLPEALVQRLAIGR